ncbi:helix-turn-helix domain-containing protein [Glacieibacterium megasporae]|uniref:helix-turn-helix domain-containing protein n=1 Tax=Glacieibacterium megasporae TaxID=2835787 RepID=UPI001C1E2F0D|nr:helix-turn-helix domain-containing protein [Polymorphobacter megasporae]
MSDALGLTPVHVNRVLRRLRVLGIMRLRGGVLVIEDIARLALLAGFDEQYLQRKLKRAA